MDSDKILSLLTPWPSIALHAFGIFALLAISALLLWTFQRLLYALGFTNSNSSGNGRGSWPWNNFFFSGPWKNTLAMTVTILSFTTLLVLVFFSLVSVQLKVSADGKPSFDEQYSKHAVQLIGLILPVLGTWVGTVLAFYFARENLEAAGQAFLHQDRQPRRRVKEFMVPISDLISFDNFDAATEQTKKIGEILEMLKLRDIPRAIFLDEKGRVRYILHEETINRAIAAGLKTQAVDGQPEQIVSNDMSLQRFLDDVDTDLYTAGKQTFRKVAETFKTIGLSGTALDCLKMFQEDGFLQNIVVTETGDKDGKPLGLITRDTLGEAAVARSPAA